MRLPEKGTPRDEVVARIREKKAADADWRGGRTWSLIYPAGEDVDAMLRDANDLYLYENALNPFRFPSLREMEVDVVEMTGGLLHAPEGFGGAMTSGGTESIIMATLAARERAEKARGVERPEMLAPFSAHPAFAKAAKYLGIELRQIPLDDDYRARVGEAERLINENTVLVVGSAPNYPFGTVDPIPELSELARIRDTTRALQEGIRAIPGLHVWAEPVMSVFSFGSDTLDIFAVGDGMDARGWHLDRQTGPDALHLMVSPEHHKVVNPFLADLREAVASHGESKGVEARYS